MDEKTKVRKATWFKKMMDKEKNTPEFKNETIKILEDELQFLLSQIKETEQERERLSKLLIAERMKVVKLEEGVEKLKYSELCGNESYFIDAKRELYKLLEKQNTSFDFLDDEKEDIYTESDGTKLK